MRHKMRLAALVAALALGVASGTASAASISRQIHNALSTANRALRTSRQNAKDVAQVKRVTSAAIAQLASSVTSLTSAVAGINAQLTTLNSKVGSVVTPTGLVKLNAGQDNVTLLSSPPFRLAANCDSSGSTKTATLFLASFESGTEDGWNGVTFGGATPESLTSTSNTGASASANKFVTIAPSGAYIDGDGLAAVNFAGSACAFDVSNVTR